MSPGRTASGVTRRYTPRYILRYRQSYTHGGSARTVASAPPDSGRLWPGDMPLFPAAFPGARLRGIGIIERNGSIMPEIIVLILLLIILLLALHNALAGLAAAAVITFIIAVLAAAGAAVTAALASSDFRRRDEETLRHLHRLGAIGLQEGGLQWKADAAAVRQALADPAATLRSRLAGMAAAAGIWLLISQPLFHALSAEKDSAPGWSESGGAGLGIIAAALAFVFGSRALAALRERSHAELTFRSTRRWEALARETAPQLHALQSAAAEITELGSELGIALRADAAAAAADCLARHQPENFTDTVLIETALSCARAQLETVRTACAAAVADYCAAAAAVCAAEAALATAPRHPRGCELTLRWQSLAEQLFSGHMPPPDGGTDHARILHAIREEAALIITAAQTETAAAQLDTAEACAILGLFPEAETAAADRVCQRLLLLWQPAAGDDVTAGQRLDEIRQASAFLQRQRSV
jgi:NADH:ubiquinone oxidoreductase subunit K